MGTIKSAKEAAHLPFLKTTYRHIPIQKGITNIYEMAKKSEIGNSTAEFLIFIAIAEGKEDGFEVIYADETIGCNQSVCRKFRRTHCIETVCQRGYVTKKPE